MDEQPEETYNPWTVVDLVFRHLVDIGLHPTLGSGGPPGGPAADLLRALGITPTAEGDVRVQHEKESKLAELRAAMMEDR
ncbi:hypothetical protein VSH64_06510 [Amycolatopsis rhabdoformis]|uniref:Uncharacterized protein n=1 Tax=Amycolatopsis rhabdoformis TaxID=1448059 RepID=A0ABZ1ICW2_9PSEU|nr:hypothetical protein [Amycolatopsis rhabdoformis]WSE31758.1 hypothetical protein VSH64_06510 [Amycolatopsis rhabdoformis]